MQQVGVGQVFARQPAQRGQLAGGWRAVVLGDDAIACIEQVHKGVVVPLGCLQRMPMEHHLQRRARAVHSLLQVIADQLHACAELRHLAVPRRCRVIASLAALDLDLGQIHHRLTCRGLYKGAVGCAHQAQHQAGASRWNRRRDRQFVRIAHQLARVPPGGRIGPCHRLFGQLGQDLAFRAQELQARQEILSRVDPRLPE